MTTYQALARKYRPQAFDDVIGQEHITDLIKKAIAGNRIHHAYLFCGPRGIGKTTCARILAMCLNCEGGPRVDLPEDSPICQDIVKGSSLDVIEIDGASNRGIDEIRSLRENIKFAPSYGRFKIYIVDEVHMLTSEAFNALLKTLEEPPAHVKFIFATTEPHKVPATIISRCQRFDFKRISIPQISETLKAVAKQENFTIDDDALYAIAKSADGSLRDSLSVLDQMSALSDRTIKADDVYSMLGLVETQYLFDISLSVARKDCGQALRMVENIINQGKDIKQLTKDLCDHFRNLMVIKVGGKALGGLVDYPIVYKDMLLEQTKVLSLGDILNAIDTLIAAQDIARVTESQRMPLELALAKLTYREGAVEEIVPLAPPPPAPAKKTEPVKVSHTAPSAASTPKADKPAASAVSPKPIVPEVKIASEPAPAIDIDKITRLWDKITHSVSREKMSTATFLQDAKPVDLRGSVFIIGFPKSCNFQKENLETKDNIALVENVIGDILAMPVRVKYEILDDFSPKNEDPSVKNVLDTFGGQVINRWHNDGDS